MRTFLMQLGAMLCVALLAGCVTPGRVSQEQNSELLARHAAGQATLECGLPCVPVFSLNQQRIQQLQRARDWDALAVAVMRADWRQDIGYFLLGLAAEGQKHYAAADRYFRMAGALATGNLGSDKCATVRNLCLGFNLPADINPRLRAIAPYLPATAAPGAASAAELIPDAPQALLGQYAVRRLMTGGGTTAERNAQLREQLLKAFEPATAQQTRGNEVARSRATAALVERLGNEPVETRLSLGMFVQLRNYDIPSKSFEIHYPVHSRANPPRLESGIYAGSSQRPGPWSGYSNSGTACVWEPGPEYVRPAGMDPFFVMLTTCHPHPATRAPVAVLNDPNIELPPVFHLQMPRDSLWPRLQMEEDKAEALIRRLKAQRMVWAELVFDLRAVTLTNNGPFNRRQVIELRQPPALTLDIQPRALVLWEATPNGSGNGPGALIGAVGEFQPMLLPPGGRLPRALVADRDYPPAAAPVPVTPRPKPAAPPPARPAKPVADDEAWIEPPPAKR